MNLIHFHGLNCYHDCIITIADYFGLHYADSFATLWSETDFRYDSYHKVYTTRRMMTNLDALGVKIESLACPSQNDTARIISLFLEGEFMIVGMDAFYIPWNQFYRTFHGPHYFIAQKTKTEIFLCFDPTYNKENKQITCEEIIAHNFDICRTSIGTKKPLQTDAIEEAREIMRTHSDTCSTLLAQIYNCVNEEQKNILMLAKYVDAMICNRYLYRFFLENQPIPYMENNLLLNDGFFLEWKAIKNGLYKAAIIKNNEGIINEIGGCFNQLMSEEISMAEKMIHGSALA